jgi:hypothetical protein
VLALKKKPLDRWGQLIEKPQQDVIVAVENGDGGVHDAPGLDLHYHDLQINRRVCYKNSLKVK